VAHVALLNNNSGNSRFRRKDTMPLLPDASVKTKYDFTRSRFEWKRQFEVAPTTNIVEEGSMLTKLPGPTGNEVVQLAQSGALAAGERPCGVALISRITADTFTMVRDVTVPAIPVPAAPLQVQLPNANLVVTTIAWPTVALGAAELYAYDNTAGAALSTIVHAAPPAPLATEVDVDPLTGLMTFNNAEAEHDITVTYRWYLTAVERDLLLRQSHVNRGAEDQFGLMTVGYGNCWLYTSMYVAGDTFTVGAPLYLYDNGLVSAFNAGGASTQFGTCISVPSPGDPYLGIEYISPA
jgi:hypothetical protein